MGIIEDFVESTEAAERTFGIREFEIFGIAVEHPFIWFIIVPALVVGILFGLRSARTGGLVTILVAIGVAVLFFSLIGTGISPPTAERLVSFMVAIPLVFGLGVFLGWAVDYFLRQMCSNREGGFLCRFVG